MKFNVFDPETFLPTTLEGSFIILNGLEEYHFVVHHSVIEAVEKLSVTHFETGAFLASGDSENSAVVAACNKVRLYGKQRLQELIVLWEKRIRLHGQQPNIWKGYGNFQELLKEKRDYYGHTEAAIEFAAEEYARRQVIDSKNELPTIGVVTWSGKHAVAPGGHLETAVTRIDLYKVKVALDYEKAGTGINTVEIELRW